MSDKAKAVVTYGLTYLVVFFVGLFVLLGISERRAVGATNEPVYGVNVGMLAIMQKGLDEIQVPFGMLDSYTIIAPVTGLYEKVGDEYRQLTNNWQLVLKIFNPNTNVVNYRSMTNTMAISAQERVQRGP